MHRSRDPLQALGNGLRVLVSRRVTVGDRVDFFVPEVLAVFVTPLARAAGIARRDNSNRFQRMNVFFSFSDVNDFRFQNGGPPCSSGLRCLKSLG